MEINTGCADGRCTNGVVWGGDKLSSNPPKNRISSPSWATISAFRMLAPTARKSWASGRPTLTTSPRKVRCLPIFTPNRAELHGRTCRVHYGPGRLPHRSLKDRHARWEGRSIDLRADPFERADHESIGYSKWRIDHAYAILPAVAYVSQHLATNVDFPPRQKAGAFGLD
jgi:hypothetical protein